MKFFLKEFGIRQVLSQFSLFAVAGSEGGDSPVERNRRNSDSVLYARPKESEVAMVFPKLKQAEIEFQHGLIASLKTEIVKYKAKVKEVELMSESGKGYMIF